MTIEKTDSRKAEKDSEQGLVNIYDTSQPNKRKPNPFTLLDNVQRKFSGIKGLTCCSTKSINEGNVDLEFTDKKARYSSTTKCKSKCCVLCQKYVNERNRAFTVEAVKRAIHADNIDIFFTSLTLPRSWNIEEQYKALTDTFTALMRQLRREYDCHYIRQVDVTFSIDPNKPTWHQHLHALIFVKGKHTTTEFLLEIEARIKKLWAKFAKKAGQNVSLDAQDIQQVEQSVEKINTLADYVCKISKEGKSPYNITYEITNSHTKNAKSTKSITFSQLVEAIYNTDGKDSKLVSIYKAFVKHAHRRPFFVKAQKLFDWLPELEIEEEENTEESAEEIEDTWKDSKRIEMHSVLYKTICAYSLRGETIDVVIDSMSGKGGLSYSSFVDLAKQSTIDPYETHLSVLTRIQKPFILFLGGLLIDKRISITKYKHIIHKIRRNKNE